MALYKGFAPKVLRLAPGGGILLLVVEFTLGVFRKGTSDCCHTYAVADIPMQLWVHHTYKMSTCISETCHSMQIPLGHCDINPISKVIRAR